MIIDWNQIRSSGFAFGDNVFNGTVSADPEDRWESLIPDITSISETSQVDPAFAENMQDDAEDDKSISDKWAPQRRISQYIAQLAMKDWVHGTRQTLGAVAQTTGIVGADLLNVSTICRADVPDIVKAFDVTDAVIGSKAFEMAINAIGVIPVVGWIIKAAYEISKTVTDVILAVQKSNTAAARRELAKSLTIPFGAMDFTRDANDALARQFFSRVKGDRADDLIRPAYGFDGNDGAFVAEGVYGDDMPSSGPGYGMAAGTIVHGSSDGGGGFGYVPGSSSMTRSIFFPTGLNSGGGCSVRSARDMASLYPTAQSLCTGWWSQVNTPGPSMFSVQPRASKGHWENYIEKMFALAEDLMKGWSCAPTGKPFTNKFKCLKDEPYLWESSSTGGMGGCGEKTKMTSGDWMTIPSEFGRTAHPNFYGYLCRLYFGIEDPFDMDKGGLSQLPIVANFTYKNDSGHDYYRANALDLSESVPVSALETLYNNQKATLKSIKCMYVSGEDDNHGNRDRFPAFNDHTLRTLWRDSVTDIFASGSWRRVSYQDMPEGEAKSQFRQLAISKGIQDVDNFNRPCAPGENPRTSDCGFKMSTQLSSGYQMPDNPTLPTAPTMNGAVLQATIARTLRRPGGSTKKKSSALPLVLGAGAIALLMMRGRK